MINVIFRKFEDNEIIALFPGIKEGNNFILSYMEIGQHGQAHKNLIKDLNQCTSKEILNMKKELENIGYKDILVSKGWKK